MPLQTIRGIAILLALLIFSTSSVLAADASPIRADMHIRLPEGSFHHLRYEGVIPQSSWYTCGPAAVATLLTYYFELPTSEEEVLEIALASMESRGTPWDDGISLLALRDALRVAGVPSEGYRITPEALIDYFDRGGLPVILHLRWPQPHFVVAIAWVDERLLVADPSFGSQLIGIAELVNVKGFDGYLLVPRPDEALALRVDVNQRRAAEAAARRVRALQSLQWREGFVWSVG